MTRAIALPCSGYALVACDSAAFKPEAKKRGRHQRSTLVPPFRSEPDLEGRSTGGFVVQIRLVTSKRPDFDAVPLAMPMAVDNEFGCPIAY